VGDFGIILGICLIFFLFQSLEFEVIFPLVAFFKEQLFLFMGLNFNVIELICFFLFIGSIGKSAQVGLHT